MLRRTEITFTLSLTVLSMIEETWYIVRESSEQCKIISKQALAALDTPPIEKWGPFETKNQAIAKRVGLIRAGKCKPS